MPDKLRTFVHNPEQSYRVLRILMLETYNKDDSSVHADLLDFIKNSPRNRIILIQLALNSLRTMSLEQRQQIYNNLETEALSNHLLSAAERILLLMAQDMLFSDQKGDDQRFKSKSSEAAIKVAVSEVLAIVCSMQADGTLLPLHDFRRAFAAAATQMSLDLDKSVVSEQWIQKLTIKNIFESLQVLKQLPPRYKARFIQVLWTCVNLDGVADTYEIEILRVICLLLRVPVPPILGS